MKRSVARLRRVALLCTPHWDSPARRPSCALRVARSMHATMRATRSRSVERARARWQRVLDTRCSAKRWRSVSRSGSSRCSESMQDVEQFVADVALVVQVAQVAQVQVVQVVQFVVQCSRRPVIAQIAQVRGGAAAELESCSSSCRSSCRSAAAQRRSSRAARSDRSGRSWCAGRRIGTGRAGLFSTGASHLAQVIAQVVA